MKIERTFSHSALLILVSAFILFNSSSAVKGQITTYNYFYRIYFTDKNSGGSFPEASDLLSERAINRRIKAGIEFPDIRDIPVSREYLDQVISAGLTLHCTSKWLNTGVFKSEEPFDTDLLAGFTFIKEIRLVKSPPVKSIFPGKLDFSIEESDFPPYDQALKMINGNMIQNAGFDGRGILIAVQDGGFEFSDEIPSLQILRNRNGIIATHDFVTGEENVFDHHIHGTAVLSILAGLIEGSIRGSAPGADFLLLRSEDTSDEFPVEEDYWAAAAEFADSAGADIITSSLGYAFFDDPQMDYKFTDLNGNSTFITRAADIAASKGILVFSSAGNERNKSWIRILAPSDGDSVMSIGAVDGYGNISAFSSAGPSADGRVKPDNCAMGVSVTVQVSPLSISRSSGTSFSCPVLSGMSACLMQAVPAAINTDIIEAIHRSADRFNLPDSLYGFGIPDMTGALSLLQNKYLITPGQPVIVYPNPTTGYLEVIFRENPGATLIEIFSLSGTLIFRKDFYSSIGRYLKITELENREQGIYFLRFASETGVYLHKIIKLDN